MGHYEDINRVGLDDEDLGLEDNPRVVSRCSYEGTLSTLGRRIWTRQRCEGLLTYRNSAEASAACCRIPGKRATSLSQTKTKPMRGVAVQDPDVPACVSGGPCMPATPLRVLRSLSHTPSRRAHFGKSPLIQARQDIGFPTRAAMARAHFSRTDRATTAVISSMSRSNQNLYPPSGRSTICSPSRNRYPNVKPIATSHSLTSPIPT